VAAILATYKNLPCCQKSASWLLLRSFSFLIMVIMLLPAVLPMLGIGEELALATNDGIICSTTNKAGLIGQINQGFSYIPFIGNKIVTESIVAISIAVLFIFLAHLIRPKHQKISFILFTCGLLFALPSMLPALSHGLKFMAMLAGFNQTAQIIADFIGTTAKHMAVYSFVSSGGTIIAAHINCIIYGVIVTSSLLLSFLFKKDKF
jgi:hypothetical protein